MSKTLKEFHGRFKIWSYSVSHGDLLLRSAKSSDRSTQIDVLFKSVAAISLPAAFDNLQINEGRLGDFQIPLSLGDLSLSKHEVFRITGRDFVGYVIAGSFFCDEADLEYWEISPLLSPEG
jgi:hypothetical protein